MKNKAMSPIHVMLGLFIITSMCRQVVTEGEKELRLLCMLPISGQSNTGGDSWIPAYHLALDDIQNHPNLLEGYKITIRFRDDQCQQSAAVDALYEELYTQSPYTMVHGPVCSVGAIATAQQTPLWNVTQFSFGATSPSLSDKKRFPLFYRMGSPDYNNNPARIDLFRKFGWQKVATIHHAVEIFSQRTEHFIKDMTAANISIVSQEIFTDDPTLRLKNLKDRDARIIYAMAYEDKMRLIFCGAYKIGLYGPKIVWIISGMSQPFYWREKLYQHDCTAEQMDQVLEGTFMFSALFWNQNSEERGTANVTVTEFRQRMQEHPLFIPEIHDDYEFYSGFPYDSMWLTALTFNCSINRMKELGINKTLDSFTYADREITEVVYKCLGQQSIVGVSGRFSFTEVGEPNRMVQIRRKQGEEQTLIAYYRQDLRPQYFEWIEGALKWKDGKIPRDSTYIVHEEIIIPPLLYGIMCALAVLGILVAIGFLVFNAVFRENKTVRMSSPNINNVLLLGCLLCYSTVFFKITETTAASICRARVFVFCLGFTTIFSSLFSKTWRVYRIFTNKKLLRMTIKDVQLLGIIGALLSVLVVIILIWELVGPHEVVIKDVLKEVYTIGNDVEVRPYVRVCVSHKSSYFSWIIFIIEGALLAFGAFLAWETRHVKIEALNDSHQIGLCLYNVVILSAVGLTLSLLLDEQVVMLYGVTSGCLIIGTTLTQCIIFVPKVIAVRCQTVEGGTSISESNPARIGSSENKP